MVLTDVLVYEGIIKDKTLCESTSELTEWKYMNPPAGNTIARTVSKSSTLNYPSQEDRYKKLLEQIAKEKKFNFTINSFTDNLLEFTLIDPLNNDKTILVTICYKPYTTPPFWRVQVGKWEAEDFKEWNEVLEVFEIPGIIKDISSLKESVSSIAEEFEVYNNLWK